MDKELHWYALRVFWNRVGQVKEMLDAKDIEYYSQTILPSYVFVHTDLEKVGDCRTLFSKGYEAFGRIDGFFNYAGVSFGLSARRQGACHRRPFQGR